MKIEIEFEKESLVAFKQEWMNAKQDGIECEVNTEIQGTRLEIVVNGERYITDVAEMANKLIEQVITGS